MSELELLLRDIQDKTTRENFFRILRYIESQIILDANWRLYEIKFDGAVTNYKHAHKLDFVPQDVVLLQVVGDRNVEFNHTKFDKTNLDITVQGACFIRFIAGRFKDRILSPSVRDGLTNVSVGTSTSPVIPATQMSRVMDCAASVAVNDWVYQSTTVNNRAVKNVDNTISTPTIGIVTDKPTSTSCEVLLIGIYSGLSLVDRGVFRLGTGGTATFTVPTTGYIQNLGVSFGDGTVFINPDKHRLLRS